MTVDTESAVLARLMEQGREQGADLLTLRALAEEASELGAGRAMERLGLADPRARADLDQLRELLSAWRDAKRTARDAVVAWVVRIVLALVMLVAVARVAYDVPLPRDPVGYVAAYALGMTSMFAIGLIIAAVAPSARAATAVAIPLFFVVMLLGGVYMPRTLLPEIVQRIGDVTPPGVQGLTDAWLGSAPQLGPLLVLAVVTVAVGTLATRVFRWE